MDRPSSHQLHPELFTVTAQHIQLLQRAYVSWVDIEFGAPAIDCKRPYGNSQVHDDIAEILGLPIPEEDMERLHAETAVVLQIFLRTGRMEPGTYRCSPYNTDWQLVAEEAPQP